MDKPIQCPAFALLAIAGFGNKVLQGLWDADLRPQFVITRKEPGPFPYYAEESMPELSARLGVPCLFDTEGENLLHQVRLDALITATYHKILQRPLLDRVTCAFNLHPSLLPRYRGPNPCHWVIRNGERRTGVTAHLLTDQIDGGPILWQNEIDILADDTQGSLRLRLAEVAARGAAVVMSDFIAGRLSPQLQDEACATLQNRPPEADRCWNAGWTIAEADRYIRAFAPFPGIKFADRLVIGVDGTAPPSPVPLGTVVAKESRRCRIRLADGDIVAQLA